MNKHSETVKLLKELKLNGVVDSVDEIIAEAEQSSASLSSFLAEVLKAEQNARSSKRLRRNLTAAHFPSSKTFDDFAVANINGISKSDISALKDLRWLDNHENILFFGPPGLGKTHLAISAGIAAVEAVASHIELDQFCSLI